MSLINPLSTPVWLQKLHWVFNPVGYMNTAVSQYPDIFSAQVVGFGDSLVFVNNPEAIQEILTNDRKKFEAAGKFNTILKPLVGDYSVMLLDGDRHRRRRQLLMPSFHGSRMHIYGELVARLTEKAIDSLTPGKPFVGRTVMQEISLQVILEAVFGLYEGERCQELKRLIAKMSEIFRSPFTSAFLFFPFLQKDLGPWSPWGNLVRQRAKIDKLLYLEIAERRQNLDPERTDILSLLMDARDEDGQPLTNQELRDELMTLLLAGQETTATAMSWALYWVHRLPEVKEKLLQELDSLNESADVMSIFRLPYLTAVCNETLRIHPVVMLTFPRVVKEPVELLGHKIEPDTILVGCMYLVHQREDLYPNHQQFKPERFLERQYSPYEFIPFGGGSRRCLGEALALFELKLVLATILSKYELNLATNQPEKPQRRGITLAPKNGVKMVLQGKRVSKTKVKVAVGSR